MMADGGLPTEYDAIILGTGSAESILAAALARIGHKVLHLDRNDYYSGDWASFHFKALQEWIVAHKEEAKGLSVNPDVDPASLLEANEHSIPLAVKSDTISNVLEEILVREEPEEIKPCIAQETSPDGDSDGSKALSESVDCDKGLEDDGTGSKATQSSHSEAAEAPTQVETSVSGGSSEETDNKPCCAEDTQSATVTGDTGKEAETKVKTWTFKDIQQQWRKFNIDLTPKVLFCRGSMVDLLISSDISKYCEFRTITRVLTLMNGKLEQVPCSRADVFTTKKVNMIEKRMLMKHLTFSMEFEKHPDEFKGYEDKPFVEFLKSKKLTSNVRHFVQHAIAMATDHTTTMEGLEATQLFLKSLGRYGNTAFLWPLYGSGELPQCFCRMCAVFGGIYCLRRTAQCMILDGDNTVKGIVDTEGLRLSAKWLIMDASYASTELLQENCKRKTVSRGILLTDRSLIEDKSEHTTLMRIPGSDGWDNATTVFELSSLSMACPKDLYVIHLTCDGKKDAKTDLQHVVDLLFSTSEEQGDTSGDKPRVLWSLFFNLADTSDVPSGDGGQLPDNVYVVGGPNRDLDFDHSISQARALFEKLCPGEEFIPKAPNPEDIIFDDPETGKPKDSGFGPEQAEEGAGDTKAEAVGSSAESATESGPKPDGATDSLTAEDATESGSKAETAADSGSAAEAESTPGSGADSGITDENVVESGLTADHGRETEAKATEGCPAESTPREVAAPEPHPAVDGAAPVETGVPTH